MNFTTASNSQIRKQCGQKNAGHSRAAWYGNARDRRMFYPCTPEVFWLRLHAFTSHTSRGETSLYEGVSQVSIGSPGEEADRQMRGRAPQGNRIILKVLPSL